MRILVIQPSNLGDALLTYPALHALWSATPAAEFHFLASPRNASVFLGDPRILRVLIWEKKAPLGRLLPLIGLFLGRRFDLIVDFRNSLVPLLQIGARRTRILGRSSHLPVHRAQAHLNLVLELGIPPASGSCPLPYGHEEETELAGRIRPDQPVVVIVPGARSHLKRWPADRFAQVADRLARDHSAQIVLVGEQSERPISEEVRRRMNQPAVDLTGRTTIRLLAALLARARLVITNDNACLHAAGIMGVPTVAIFGPTDERKYGPRAPGSAVVRRHLVCAPCERALCPYGHECMAWIEPEEVYRAAAGILSSAIGASGTGPCE